MTRDGIVRLVLAVTLLGLIARLVLLGDRVMHYDEARVAWWSLEYLRTGSLRYRFIIHGPLIQYAHRLGFAALGPTDFAARLPVALLGGLLPLAALALRAHLSRVEVVALAGLLAVDPVLLYYGRFARSTVLVAGLCFLAFVALVRWYDGHGPAGLYAAGVLLALGFAAKENAIVYVLCWIGAAGLLLAEAALRPVLTGDPRTDWRAWVAAGREHLRRRVAIVTGRRDAIDDGTWRRPVLALAGHSLAAGVLALVLVFVLFAPRGGDAGLWTGNLALTLERTVGDLAAGLEYWFGHGTETSLETYRERLRLFLETAGVYAGPLFAFAIAGAIVEGLGEGRPRRLVLGCSYWGFASVVGYPLGADIWGAWIVVNALVPLAVPAAVGVGALLDVGRAALADADHVSAALAGLLCLLALGQLVVVGAPAVYLEPTEPDNGLVQYAQPQAEMGEAVEETVAIAARHEDGPDVLFYGSVDLVDMAEADTRTPACLAWSNTLPWAWYLDANRVSVTCARQPGDVPEALPPVVVTDARCSLPREVQCRERPGALVVDESLRDRLPADYERRGFLHRTTGGNFFDGMVVFTDPDA